MSPFVAQMIRLGAFLRLFVLLSLISVTVLANPLSVNPHLITFAPEVRLESGDLCQGVRVANGYIATSTSCAEVIRDQMLHTVFEVTGALKAPVGIIVEDYSYCPFAHCDTIFRMMNDNSDDSGGYPALHVGNATNLAAYADLIANDGYPSRSVFSLKFNVGDAGQSIFSVSGNTALPSGTPVFDLENNIICLVSTANDCLSLPDSLYRLKRDAGVDDEENNGQNGGLSNRAYIAAGIATAALILAINGACMGINACRACSKGMPCSIFLKSVLTLSYCVPPHTDKCIPLGWWGVLWSWVGAYDSARHQRFDTGGSVVIEPREDLPEFKGFRLIPNACMP